MYAFNPQAQVQWLELGQSRTRALVIDDALLDLSQIRQDAVSAAFRQDKGSYYPGIRAELPQAYARCLLEALYPLLLQLVQPPPECRLIPQQWYLSLLTTPAAQLLPLQRLPHFDKAEPLHLPISQCPASPTPSAANAPDKSTAGSVYKQAAGTK